MILGEHNNRQLIENVVASLTDAQSLSSWTLVVPPGFGESYVPQEIASRLRSHVAAPRVALVKADRVEKKADLLQQLWKQWCGESTHPTDPNNWEGPELADVLGAVGKTPKRVQIISRFHRILDWVDESILQDIRDAEHSGAIQTVVVSMYPLDWIKHEWREKGKALLASDYGVEHSKRGVLPLQPGECFQLFRTLDGQQIPPELIRLAISWTGGYPEYMRAVLQHWLSHNKPDWSTPEWQRRLYGTAIDEARRLAEAVDRHGSATYRRLIVGLHLRAEDDYVRDRLQRAHPWGEILLDDGGLRSDGLGEACLDLEIRDCVEAREAVSPSEARYDRCLSLYRSRQYEQVLRILGERAGPADSSAVQLLRYNARIMDAVYARGIDAEWRKVTSAIREARESLNAARLSARDKDRIADRLASIDALASSLLRASGMDSRRIVDVLAGLSGGADAIDQKTALSLLLLQFEAARTARGNLDPILKSLSLAEQVLRVWAWWQLSLNYYVTPSGRDSTWSLAGEEWRSARGSELKTSNPGDPFPGIVPFAYFAVAALVEHGTSASAPVPAASFAELKKQVFVFEWRNDAAHSVAIFDSNNRGKFLDVIDRWLECLCACLPGGPIARKSVLSVIEPLPTIQDDRLIWSS